MLLFTETITPRIRYITGFVGDELFGSPFLLTDDIGTYRRSAGPKINYSATAIENQEIRIHPVSLLFETDVREQQVKCVSADNRTIFFTTSGYLPFDIFAATFYLISRYEEYLPYTPDLYGRYPFSSSLAYKNNFLGKPLVNIWLKDFAAQLKIKFPSLVFKEKTTRFLPTYDIDEAYAYQHKGWVRNTGGLLRDFFTGGTDRVRERLLVLTGKKKDPYDSLEGMREINSLYQLSPVYFFLVAAKNAGVDKNILPHKNSIRTMIKMQSALYATGLHPSWQSGDQEKGLQQEKKTLEEITGNPVTRSRQHFIRFTLPGGYRRLIENGISEDYSLGYGSINGFRASVAASFLWYDLEKEETTGLRIFPFCFMDANSFYEQHQTAAATLEEMRNYYQSVNEVNGLFSMIWHNTFLGTDKRFTGWRAVYTSFLQQVCIAGK